MVRTKPWEVGDEVWATVEPLVPPERPKPKGGRPRMSDRMAFEAMVYVLRTGIQWNALPREMGASSTVHARFQEWARAGFFARLHQAGLAEYDEFEGIEWEWPAVDAALGKAPLVPTGGTGGGAADPNPTDRSKRGILTDGNGIPLAVALDGANRHDSQLLAATIDGIVVRRPNPEEGEPHPGGEARRWVMERTHVRRTRSRRLLVRWEKKTENYLAFTSPVPNSSSLRVPFK